MEYYIRIEMAGKADSFYPASIVRAIEENKSHEDIPIAVAGLAIEFLECIKFEIFLEKEIVFV
ncbi:MAG TPA: hypothetical protein VF540_01165 [Segetibacter sp.]